ncbi:GTP-binding protein-like protein [Emericellopsis cladophorae]|uniref:GTP-binding protein-like protein n=1 Tax=Emericellopsis cladophorae TaxID=2686198 RepID=A0A9P9Y5A6_9HYPO|nr:GTP-binding protein-like protein [Emericellopsis cladophorae]KAI6783610.1 GTP-binding protein-like protein [Emericellopsis cladophorae]
MGKVADPFASMMTMRKSDKPEPRGRQAGNTRSERAASSTASADPFAAMAAQRKSDKPASQTEKNRKNQGRRERARSRGAAEPSNRFGSRSGTSDAWPVADNPRMKPMRRPAQIPATSAAARESASQRGDDRLSSNNTPAEPSYEARLLSALADPTNRGSTPESPTERQEKTVPPFNRQTSDESEEDVLFPEEEDRARPPTTSWPRPQSQPSVPPAPKRLFSRTKIEGNPSVASLAPMDLITVPAPGSPPTKPQSSPPVAVRGAMATADRFFRQNYKFLFSASEWADLRPQTHTPEIIVLGASNVGKSTFINSLLGRTDVARTSSKPGRTRTLNAYGVGQPADSMVNQGLPQGTDPANHGLVVMDAPGYGHGSHAAWGAVTRDYINKRTMLKGAILLLPAEKRISDMDRWTMNLLAQRGIKLMVILTKADRAGKEWYEYCLNVAAEVRANINVIKNGSKQVHSSWSGGTGWVPEIHVTAAAFPHRRSIANAPGMRGVRLAILRDMLGMDLDATTSKVEANPEDISYGGDTVSWDDMLRKMQNM